MCKFNCNKKKELWIPWITTRNWLTASALSGILLLGLSSVKAQEVGEAISIDGNADYRPDYTAEETELELIEKGLGIEVKYMLQTRPSKSRVKLLLLFGDTYTISENSHVRVEKRIGNKIYFGLKGGTIRAVTSRSGGIRFITSTEGGEATALDSGYIISCGPPSTSSQDSCLYVGLYGSIEVNPLVSPSKPVILERQFYTVIQKGMPPDPNPPQKLSDLQFQKLIHKTTIVGTGDQNDRLELTSIDELTTGNPLPPLWPQKEPQAKIPDVPLQYFEPLPLPPQPPSAVSSP